MRSWPASQAGKRLIRHADDDTFHTADDHHAWQYPATIAVDDTHQDSGATAKDAAGHDLTVHTFLNGQLIIWLTLDRSTPVTNTID